MATTVCMIIWEIWKEMDLAARIQILDSAVCF